MTDRSLHWWFLRSVLCAAVVLSFCVPAWACGGGETDVSSTSSSVAEQTQTTTVTTGATGSTAVPSDTVGENGQTTSSTGVPLTTEDWDVEVTVDITDPAAYSFTGTGPVTFASDGSQVVVTGSVSIGNLTLGDLLFEGALDGEKFTLLTTEYQLQFEVEGTTYTEDLSLVVPDFDYAGDSLTGTGEIRIVKNPGGSVESGTFTYVATKK